MVNIREIKGFLLSNDLVVQDHGWLDTREKMWIWWKYWPGGPDYFEEWSMDSEMLNRG